MHLLPDAFSFALPVVKEKYEMDFFLWEKKSDLMVNRFGIKEPKPDEKNKVIPDQKTLVLVPSVALDKKGNRLGMGLGYYDRYFAKYPKACKVGVVFSCCVVDNIPREDHDLKVDYIATDKGIEAAL